MRFVGRPTFQCLWDGEGDFEDYLGLDRATYEAVKLSYRQGGFKRFSPSYERELVMLWDSQKICNDRGIPFELWMTTTRPYNRLDSTDPDTRFWLEQKGVNYDHLLYDEHKYKRLAEIVGPDRVVFVAEDLPEYIEEARDSLFNALLYMPKRYHNMAYRERSSFVQAGQPMPFSDLGTLDIVRVVEQWYKEQEGPSHE